MKIASIETIHHEEAVPVYDVIEAAPLHNFVVDAGSHIVLSNCDEVNFSRSGVKDVKKAKRDMQDTYNTISARVKGTFRKGGKVFGKMFAISSKKSDSDFMEDYVNRQLTAGAGESMYIFDKPQWEVLPESMFSRQKFFIAVGDRHKKGFVIPENQSGPESLDELREQGYKILTPPIDMKPEFSADFEIALRDLAGISVPGALSYITQDSITRCIDYNRKNAFYNDILQIGTKDSFTIEEFFHFKEIEHLKNIPTYIHLDLSLNTDKSGITGVGISGRKDISDIDGKTTSCIALSHLFTVSLQAPRGDAIPYDKVYQFLLWLRRQGLNIRGISRDQFQSEYLGQLLQSSGFQVDKLSLDRTPDGYIALKSVLLEERIDMLDCNLLQDELIHLQRDATTGKIDHPVGGSKDAADSLAGAVWNAILKNPSVPISNAVVNRAIASVNGPKVNSPSHSRDLLGHSMQQLYKNANKNRWR